MALRVRVLTAWTTGATFVLSLAVNVTVTLGLPPRCATTSRSLRSDVETLVCAATALRTRGPPAVAWKAATNWVTPWAPVYCAVGPPTRAGGSTVAVAMYIVG